MKKAFYVLIVMVLLMSMLPSPAAAKKGTGMYVADITGNVYRDLETGNYVYKVFVTIMDVNGNPVVGARVVASTTANSKLVTALTDDNGVAYIRIETQPSSLTLTVDNVVKRGYIYSPELNAISSLPLSAS